MDIKKSNCAICNAIQSPCKGGNREIIISFAKKKIKTKMLAVKGTKIERTLTVPVKSKAEVLQIEGEKAIVFMSNGEEKSIQLNEKGVLAFRQEVMQRMMLFAAK